MGPDALLTFRVIRVQIPLRTSSHTRQNLPHIKFDKVIFQMVAVTLRMKPRSNMWYVLKGIVKYCNIIHEHRLIC